jgi:glycosyltransferase involved in cell wall biosynthesis
VAAHLTMLHEVRRRAEEFDVIHFHVEPLHLPLFENMAERTVTTMHGRLDLKDLPELYGCWPQFPLVSISNHQRRPLPQANWLDTIYHGLPIDLLQPGFETGGYLAFLGRISPEKRPDRAIEIAKRAGMPLKIAAKVDAVDRAYFHDTIEPLLDHPLVEWIGEIGDADKSLFLRRSRGSGVSDRLAGTVRSGLDRGDGLWHSGDRLGLRLGARGDRRRRHRLHRRLDG